MPPKRPMNDRSQKPSMRPSLRMCVRVCVKKVKNHMGRCA